MRRRDFMTLIGGAAVLPRAGRAQQASPFPRVGLVSIGADPGDPVVFRPFLEQLRELGYIEGRNVTLEQYLHASIQIAPRCLPKWFELRTWCPQWVCAVKRRRVPVGANPTRQTAPAGSNRSSHGGDEMAEAFG